MKFIMSLILAVTTFFSNIAGALFPDSQTDADAIPVLSQEFVLPREPSAIWNAGVDGGSGELHEDVNFAAMEYVHYDGEIFWEKVDRLGLCAVTGDVDEMCDLSDELYQEYVYITNLSALCYLHHISNIHNEYWEAEHTYITDLQQECYDALFGIFDYAMDFPCGEEFAAYLGEDVMAALADYEPLNEEEYAEYAEYGEYNESEEYGETEEEETFSSQERVLVDKYYALFDGINDIPYTWQGEDWTLDRLYGEEGAALGYQDYIDIYYGLQQTLCETFAPTYIELIRLWQEQAQSYGYDSYIDYAYNEVYCRDYTPADAQALCDAIKPIAREYYATLYDSDLNYAWEDVTPIMNAEELVSTLGAYLPRVDSSLYEAWEYMTDHELYDLRPVDSGRASGAFTISLPLYNSAFVHASREGNCYDFTTLTHEFGHFCNFYYNSPPNILLCTDDLDLSEIHSNGLQALFTAFYSEIFGDDGYIVEFANLTQLLGNIIDGCVYDEFQRRVFENADSLSAEELNRIYLEVRGEYGMYDVAPPWDAAWTYVSHNFETPFYYISYAASAMAALQIWDISRSDFNAAADLYMNILDQGAYAQGYFSVLENCGLALFTDENVPESVCRPALDRLLTLDVEYGS